MVNLAELTYHLGLTDDSQWVAASFAGSTGPWSDAEASEFVKVWDAQTQEAGQPHNATDQCRCTECGHTTRDYVPGCDCCNP